MKNLFLLFFLLFSLQHKAHAQTYFPISIEGAVFTCYNYSPGGPPPPPWMPPPSPTYYALYNSGDTIWNGVLYKKQYRIGFEYDSTGVLTSLYSPMIYRLLRDDITQQKTYFINAAYVDSTEHLLQDFSLSVGDPVDCATTYESSYYGHIISDDSILIGSVYHRVWNIDFDFDFGTTIYPMIEGIGIFGGVEYSGPGLIVYDGIICYNDGMGNSYGDSICLDRNDIASLLGVEILPLHLLSFSAAATCQEVVLAWTLTNDEEDTYNIIQRSTDAKNWQDIATISIEKTGNNVKNFSYNDDYKANENTYYRIVTVGRNAAEEYSAIQSVKNNCIQENAVTLSLNPAAQVIQLLGLNAGATVSLYDTQGKLLLVKTDCESGCEIDISSLSNGSYIVNVHHARESKSIKFTKNI